MAAAKRLGAVSLAACVAGMITMEALLHGGVLADPWWRVLAMACEAGTIGGLADWFAVSALFRRVPIPLLSRHTDIIARNRPRLVASLQDYVQNRLLTREAIREKLAGVRFSSHVLAWLESDGRQRLLHQALRALLARAVQGLAGEEVVRVLERTALARLQALDLATPLSTWVPRALAAGGHHGLWQDALRQGRILLQDPATGQLFATLIAEAMASSKRKGLGKLMFIGTGELTGGFNYGEWAAAIISGLLRQVEAMQADPHHPLRTQVEARLLALAHEVADPASPAAASVDAFRRSVLAQADLAPLIRRALAEVAVTVTSDLADESSALAQAIARLADDLLARLRQDAALQEVIDGQLREVVGAVVERNHDLIGEMVGSSLAPEKLSDQQLIAQIEERVGDDLQYIRLNGAIVGGAVGALIMAVKLLCFGAP